MNDNEACTSQVKAYTTQAEAKVIWDLARADGRTVSAFVRRVLLDVIATK